MLIVAVGEEPVGWHNLHVQPRHGRFHDIAAMGAAPRVTFIGEHGINPRVGFLGTIDSVACYSIGLAAGERRILQHGVKWTNPDKVGIHDNPAILLEAMEFDNVNTCRKLIRDIVVGFPLADVFIDLLFVP